MPFDIVGFDPGKDYLLDLQQRDVRLRAVCGCCGHGIREGEAYYELDVQKDVIAVCADCREEMREVVA